MGQYVISPDPLWGSDDNDELFSVSPKSNIYYKTIAGQDGDDVIHGGMLDDMLYGGHGDDRLYGGDGDDQLYGGKGDDYIEGNGDGDLLSGGAGADYLVGGAGIDIFYGGEGSDTVSYLFQGSGVGVAIDLLEGRGYDTADGERFYDIENVDGTEWADVLSGNDEDNELAAYGGTDALYGLGGNDRLWGGSEDDVLVGGEGNDRINGGGGTVPSGNDFLEGDAGEDIFVFDQYWGDDEIFDFEDGIDLIEFHDGAGGPLLTDWSQLSITRDGIDILISYGNDSIRVWGWGVQIEDFSADDFLFT